MLWIWIRIRNLDLDPEGQKISLKNRKKGKIFMFWSVGCFLLWAEGLLLSLWRPLWRLRDKQIAIFNKKRHKKVKLYFFQFLITKTRINLKYGSGSTTLFKITKYGTEPNTKGKFPPIFYLYFFVSIINLTKVKNKKYDILPKGAAPSSTKMGRISRLSSVCVLYHTPAKQVINSAESGSYRPGSGSCLTKYLLFFLQ